MKQASESLSEIHFSHGTKEMLNICFVALPAAAFEKIKMITFTKADIILCIAAYRNFECCEKGRIFKGLFVNVYRGIVPFY